MKLVTYSAGGEQHVGAVVGDGNNQIVDLVAADRALALARSGEFRTLGELHYGDALRTRRAEALRALLAALAIADGKLAA